MRVDGRAEYSNLGKIEWIPGISSFIGIGRLIHSLYCAIFDPKAIKDQSVNNLKGRVEFWSDEKRAAVALIPIFGNALIIWHDCHINQKLNQLENQLRKASEETIEQVFSEFPDDVKNTKSTMLNLVKVNSKILQYTDLKNDPTFMQQVAKQRIEDLKYAPETMMSNKAFILAVVEATDLDLFAKFPQLIEIFCNDPSVMVEMARRNLDNLKYATQLMADESFVLDTAKKLYNDSYYCFAYNSPKNRPFYCRQLDILRYAPGLCTKPDFMLKAKLQPYLNPIQYATYHANNGEFILQMMTGYRETGGWWKGSMGGGIQIGRLNQTLPLHIASKKLRDNVEFMKKAIEIDNASWKFASKGVQNKIFNDRTFLSRNCNGCTFMMEALRRNRNNIDLVSSSLLKDERFKKFVSENYSLEVYRKYYGSV